MTPIEIACLVIVLTIASTIIVCFLADLTNPIYDTPTPAAKPINPATRKRIKPEAISKEFWDQLDNTHEALGIAFSTLWPEGSLHTLEALDPVVRNSVILMLRADVAIIDLSNTHQRTH